MLVIVLNHSLLKITTLKTTNKLMKRKTLMVSTVSLESFAYDVIDIFCFPTPEVNEIYKQNKIIRYFAFLNLKYTDSCSISFFFYMSIFV